VVSRLDDGAAEAVIETAKIEQRALRQKTFFLRPKIDCLKESEKRFARRAEDSVMIE
jgi:hypothetical protein